MKDKRDGFPTDGENLVGDRLSSISSLPTERSDIYSQSQQAAESRLIAQMREQLFTLTGKLQQEHRAKEMALVKLNDLRGHVAAQGHHQLTGCTEQDEDSGNEILLSRSATSRETTPSLTPPQTDLPTSPALASPKPFTIDKVDDSESSISKRFTPDFTRLKSWGFPATPPTGSDNVPDSKEKKRESFFGLSNPLRRASSDDGPRISEGIDLPPFVVDENTPGVFPALVAGDLPTLGGGVNVRAVSDPTSLQSYGKGTLSDLPGIGPAQFRIPTITVNDGGAFRAAGVMCSGILDFRKGCRCCVGDVVEV